MSTQPGDEGRNKPEEGSLFSEGGSALQPSNQDETFENLLASNSVDDDETEVAGATSGTKTAKATSKSQKSKKARKAAKNDLPGNKGYRNTKLTVVAVAAASAILLGGAGTAIYVATSPDKAQIDPDRNDSRVQKKDSTDSDATNGGNGESSTEKEKDAPWNTEEGQFPVELDKWQQTPINQGFTAEDEEELLQDYLGSNLESAASVLPIEAAGFTSDDEAIYNEDGSLNPYYSFWTQESFLIEAGQLIEKFVNPRFGNWEEYQGDTDPNSMDPAKVFPGTFTTELLDSNDARSIVPVYADWGNNNYGRGDLAVTGPRWYGEVANENADFVWNEEEEQYSVNYTSDVTFTAYTSDGDKVTENGKLELEFVANPNGEKGPGGKVLVNRSKLTIGE